MDNKYGEKTLNISEMAKLLTLYPADESEPVFKFHFKGLSLFFSSISAISAWNQNFMNFYVFFCDLMFWF